MVMESRLLADELEQRTAEIEHALLKAEADSIRISSKKGLRNHIIGLAQHCGFDIFLTPVFGYEEFTVRTRLRHARRYGKPPTTKMLVISHNFVRNVYRIYRAWPALGEFFIRTALWHEYRHLQQNLDTNPDPGKREHEANAFMLEKSGRPGLIVSIWYYTLHREIGLLHRLLDKTSSPEKNDILERTIKSIRMIYHELIPPELYDEFAEDVFWLEGEYKRHRKRQRFFLVCGHCCCMIEPLFF